ncbi:hypothetical protein D3C77_777200 [compost metagenome]
MPNRLPLVIDTLVAQYPVGGANVFGHFENRQQVFQLTAARRIIAEHRQGVVMICDGIAQMLG